MLAENKQVLSGIEQLAQKINASNDKAKTDAETLAEYTKRLRREGSGR